MLLRYVIGGVLRRLRRDRGMTLEQVARRARVSVPYLSEVERGRKEASSEVLAGICQALGLTLAELLREAVQDASQRIVTARPLDPRHRRGARPGVGRDRGVQCSSGPSRAVPGRSARSWRHSRLLAARRPRVLGARRPCVVVCPARPSARVAVS